MYDYIYTVMYNVETKAFLLSEFGGSSKLSQEANEKSLHILTTYWTFASLQHFLEESSVLNF